MAASSARFSAFARGRVVGMADAGATRAEIRDAVRKTDGASASCRAIDAIVAHGRAGGGYDGSNSSAGGRPQALSAREVACLRAFMHAEVGLARVALPYCKKRLPFLRRLSHEGVRLALRRLGLAWRLRRGKAAIPCRHKSARLAYCRWVVLQCQAYLSRWAYVDGTPKTCKTC